MSSVRYIYFKSNYNNLAFIDELDKVSVMLKTDSASMLCNYDDNNRLLCYVVICVTSQQLSLATVLTNLLYISITRRQPE